MALVSIRNSMEDIVLFATGMNKDTLRSFEFEVDKTPLSSIHFPLLTVITYCIFIPLLQNYMKGRKSPPLKHILLVHNVFLTVISGFMALFLFSTVMSFTIEKDYSYFRAFCSLNHYDQSGSLTFIYYINYLLKYYELLDTIFLALKNKNIGFLHAYHHPATLVLTWSQLVDSTGVQWVVIILNLCVHTVMYFYYTMSALKVRMPWKRLVTIMQILQFILDLVACFGAWAIYNFYGQCFGTQRAGLVGCFILTSYLYLFVDFYQITYNKNKNKNKNKIKNSKNIKQPLKELQAANLKKDN